MEVPGTASLTDSSTTVIFSELPTLPANTPLFFRVNTPDCPPDSFPNHSKFLPQYTATDITNSTTVTLRSPHTGTSSVATDVWDSTTRGVLIGDEAESTYLVVDRRRCSDQCCFGYGNPEMFGCDDGNGTTENIYFGTDVTWGGTVRGPARGRGRSGERHVPVRPGGGDRSRSRYRAPSRSTPTT